MRRRAVLLSVGGALAGSVAGCNSSTGTNASPTPSPTASSIPTTTPSDSSKSELQRTVVLDDQDTVPETHQVSIDVDVLDPAITSAKTARIRLTITNEGPQRAFKVGPDDCNLFNRGQAGSDDPGGLWLYLPKETRYLDRKGEQWVPDRSPSKPRSYNAAACAPRTYVSGEAISTAYEVWDDYRVNGYLQPDTYRWEEDVEIWEDSEARATEPPTATFTWGFSLSIEKAD